METFCFFVLLKQQGDQQNQPFEHPLDRAQTAGT
jgi:hypothetical protein